MLDINALNYIQFYKNLISSAFWIWSRSKHLVPWIVVIMSQLNWCFAWCIFSCLIYRSSHSNLVYVNSVFGLTEIQNFKWHPAWVFASIWWLNLERHPEFGMVILSQFLCFSFLRKFELYTKGITKLNHHITTRSQKQLFEVFLENIKK